MRKKHLADILIMSGLLLVSLATFAGIKISKNPANPGYLCAKVYRKDKLEKSINLENVPDSIHLFSLEGLEDHLTFACKKGAICVYKSDCPNKTCVNRGWVSGGLPIICAHYAVSVYVENTSSDVDAII